MRLQRLAFFAAGTALALSAVFGAAKYAYAEGEAANAKDTATYNQAVITKELETVPGQALNEIFTFTFEPYNDEQGVNPPLSPAFITLDTTITAKRKPTFKFDPKTARVTYYANTSNLVSVISDDFEEAGAKPGIYMYKVVETKGNNQSMTYDDSVYFLRVINQASGVSVQVIKSDESKTKPSNIKVDPTPDKDRKITFPTDAVGKYLASDFTFKNSYKLGENAVVGKTFTLKKVVNGLDAAGTKYSFNVQFITPDAKNAANITAAGQDGASSPANDTQGGFTVELTRDQFVVFSNIQEGTLYTITETSAGSFTPSAEIKTGAALNTLLEAKTVVGTEGNANGYAINFESTNRAVVAGATENSLTVTNTYKQVNPTGIIINNLPFVLMVGIPVVAAVGYVASRRKA